MLVNKFFSLFDDEFCYPQACNKGSSISIIPRLGISTGIPLCMSEFILRDSAWPDLLGTFSNVQYIGGGGWEGGWVYVTAIVINTK